MGMKVELDIADDSELRNAVKDLIKGEVKSVMRSEIKEILKDLTGEMVIPKDSVALENLLRQELRNVIKTELKIGEYGWSTDIIRKMARDEVGNILRESFKRDQFHVNESL